MTPDLQLIVDIDEHNISDFWVCKPCKQESNFTHRLAGVMDKLISQSVFVLSMLIYLKEQLIMTWHVWKTQREGFR